MGNYVEKKPIKLLNRQKKEQSPRFYLLNKNSDFYWNDYTRATALYRIN